MRRFGSFVEFGRDFGRSDPEAFEWYLDYSVYRHIITAEVPLEASVCISGCGNSGTLGPCAAAKCCDVDSASLALPVAARRHADRHAGGR